VAGKKGSVQRRRRIAAYGVATDGDGRVLLVRASVRSNTPGVWTLPGGGIEHGEDPAEAAVREFAEETGLAAAVTGLRAVVSDITEMPWRGVELHHDRIVYDMAVVGGQLRDERDGTSDVAAWLSPAELAAGRAGEAGAGMPVMPFVAELLGVPSAAATAYPPGARPEVPDTAGELTADGVAAVDAQGRPVQVRRFAVYGLVTDPAGRVLLTLIAPGYPGAGLWHLPGGGTDYGEQPAAALLRELAEEADQVGRVVDLLAVMHRHNPAALGPEGHPIDWHGIRAIYRVTVDAPTEPRVTEAAGSTVQARWFPPAATARLAKTDVAVAALRLLAQ
jgi:ADP-ribose pyrophosphatase YjhB (NUDIX family)